MAVTVIVVMVMMSFAGEKHGEKQNQADDESRGPSVAQAVGGKEGIEGDVTRQRPGAEVIREDPQSLEAGVVGATLHVDGKETCEESGGEDEQEDRERRPSFDGVVMDLFGLLLEVSGDGGFRLGRGGLDVERLALRGGLGLGDGLLDQTSLHDGFLGVGRGFGQRIAHVMISPGGDAVEDRRKQDEVEGQAEAAERLGKIQREAHGCEAAT